MTVAVAESDKRFHGTGSGGPFTWTWRFLVNTDVLVYRVPVPNESFPWLENRILLVEGTDYTLAGAGSYTGGSLILNEALAVGADLYVERNTQMLQTVSIRNQGNNFRPEIHEDVFDRLTMMIQDRERRLTFLESKSFEVTVNQTTGGTETMTEVDTSAGNVLVNLPASGTVLIMKKGENANTVSWAVTVGGQTLPSLNPLSADGEFVRLSLFGTAWRVTG